MKGEWKFVHGICVTWLRWPQYPYMVKTHWKSLQNWKANDLETWYAVLGTQVLPNLSSDDPCLTLIYFKSVKLGHLRISVYEKGQNRGFFYEAIVANVIRVDLCSQLNELFINIKGQGHLLTLVIGPSESVVLKSRPLGWLKPNRI